MRAAQKIEIQKMKASRKYLFANKLMKKLTFLIFISFILVMGMHKVISDFTTSTSDIYSSPLYAVASFEGDEYADVRGEVIQYLFSDARRERVQEILYSSNTKAMLILDHPILNYQRACDLHNDETGMLAGILNGHIQANSKGEKQFSYNQENLTLSSCTVGTFSVIKNIANGISIIFMAILFSILTIALFMLGFSIKANLKSAKNGEQV